MPIALFALALGGFGIGLTEFVIMGLLPEVAADFAVSETVAGYLISGYALGVAVGAIGLTVAITRIDRKKALVGLMVIFIAGNVLSALAPSYEMMMLGRIIAALNLSGNAQRKSAKQRVKAYLEPLQDAAVRVSEMVARRG